MLYHIEIEVLYAHAFTYSLSELCSLSVFRCILLLMLSTIDKKLLKIKNKCQLKYFVEN